MQAEDVAGDDVEVWPENAEAVLVFTKLRTQWRHGMSGITGLEYGALDPVMRMVRVPRERRGQIFEDVRIMEGAVLKMAAERSSNG